MKLVHPDFHKISLALLGLKSIINPTKMKYIPKNITTHFAIIAMNII